MLVVSPNITWPTSIVTFWCALTYSASGTTLAVERVLVAFAAAVAVKLDVRDVAAMAFEGLHGFQRRRPVAGHAQVVAVDVDGVRQPQFVGRLGDAADDLPRRDVEVIDRLSRGRGRCPPDGSSRLRRRPD